MISKKSLIAIISILLVVAIASLMLPKTNIFAAKENILGAVKLATFAVCEQKEGYTYCRDKIFAACNKTLIEINDSFFYCNGERHEISNISLGETYIKGESMPEKSLITGWATSN